jgi:methylthioxylose transferase
VPITTRTTPRISGTAADLTAVSGATLIVLAAALVGQALLAVGVDIFLPFPPLLAEWLPHVGPGTPVAVAVAVLVAAQGPALADRLPWGRLLAVGFAASVAWTVALALVDGWQRGVVERLTSSQEYLHDVPRVTDVGAMLRTFADHILTDQPGFWTTHVGAHPPGALLTFVWLDRLGLGGGGPAGLFVMLVGASAPVAVAIALRALGAEDVARRALPFGVLLPGAVWVGVSADGMFAGVLAWGVALLAVGATAHGPRADLAALAGGVLLGWCLYLSYGLVLGGLPALAVLAVTRNLRAGVLATTGTLAVIGAFTASGFWWFTGFERVQVIYAASIAAARPYAYFVWANLAAVLLALGPAVVAGVRRAVTHPRALPAGAVLLAGAGLAAILLADLSGLSKAEVERIWLPFAVWLPTLCALLPHARYWLAAQAGLALAVNHLLLTVW